MAAGAAMQARIGGVLVYKLSVGEMGVERFNARAA